MPKDKIIADLEPKVKKNWYFISYRLDGITSGVVVKAKDPDKALKVVFPIDQLLNINLIQNG